jgi:hypothetical protein
MNTEPSFANQRSRRLLSMTRSASKKPSRSGRLEEQRVGSFSQLHSYDPDITMFEDNPLANTFRITDVSKKASKESKRPGLFKWFRRSARDLLHYPPHSLANEDTTAGSTSGSLPQQAMAPASVLATPTVKQENSRALLLSTMELSRDAHQVFGSFRNQAADQQHSPHGRGVVSSSIPTNSTKPQATDPVLGSILRVPPRQKSAARHPDAPLTRPRSGRFRSGLARTQKARSFRAPQPRLVTPPPRRPSTTRSHSQQNLQNSRRREQKDIFVNFSETLHDDGVPLNVDFGWTAAGGSTSVHSASVHSEGSSSLSSGPDSNSRASRTSSRAYSCRKPGPQSTLMEIAPGLSLPLRTTAETLQAVQRDTLLTHDCVSCTAALYCMQQAEVIVCPYCRVIEPLRHGQSGGGVGMGFGARDLWEMRNAIAVKDDDDDDVDVK